MRKLKMISKTSLSAPRQVVQETSLEKPALQALGPPGSPLWVRQNPPQAFCLEVSAPQGDPSLGVLETSGSQSIENIPRRQSPHYEIYWFAVSEAP